MGETDGLGFELRESPGDLITAPVDRVTALLPDADAAVSLVADLDAAGVSPDEVYVLTGPEGARRLDPTGRHHGLLGRLYRFVEQAGSVREMIERMARHVNEGGIAISIPATDQESAPVAELVAGHGGWDIVHHGKFAWTPLGGTDPSE